MVFALVGNQNCGKTTLFNQLTGSNQHTGNFPGITVDQKSGIMRELPDTTIVDLPGIYSLRPFSNEEIVTRDFLIHTKPDGIINIVDATNLERNLYLTVQLLELGIPMVLAVNMMDELRSNGGSIDMDLLSRELGIPAAPVSALRKEGLELLCRQVAAISTIPMSPQNNHFYSGPVQACVCAVTDLITGHAAKRTMPLRFAAIKLMEGDALVAADLGLGASQRASVESSIHLMEEALGTDRNAALADARYAFIEKLCSAAVVKPAVSKERIRSMKIDRLLTHRVLAIPLFLLIMLGVFSLTFGVIGNNLSNLLLLGIDSLIRTLDFALGQWGINPVLHSLVVDGVLAGVGSVLSFLPIIITLFFFLSLLEDSGYMARVAFVMDKPLRKIGLSGRSIVPMLVGFGCTVPAVLATRTLSSDRDRKMTILLTPFMSCSAKIPIYAVFTAAFFQQHQALVMMALYIMGIFMGILCGGLLRSTVFTGASTPFVMELPNYRMPSPKTVALLMWDKARDFLERAFTVILLATVLIWFLESFNYQFNMVDDSSKSLLGTLGMALTPLFAPLGFHDWRIPTALLTGLTAKEQVVSTLAILTGSSVTDLPAALGALFTPLTAFCFLTFTLLYTPCIAAITVMEKELGSLFSAVKVVFLQCCIAWITTFFVFHIGRLLGLGL